MRNRNRFDAWMDRLSNERDEANLKLDEIEEEAEMKRLKSLNRVALPASKRKQLRTGAPGAGKHSGGHVKPKERNQRG